MVESNLTYEECRRQRLEENKKRMEELNLNKLADALKSSSTKSSPVGFRCSKCFIIQCIFQHDNEFEACSLSLYGF